MRILEDDVNPTRTSRVKSPGLGANSGPAVVRLVVHGSKRVHFLALE